MGAFDDLVPGQSGGSFDDLVPQEKKPSSIARDLGTKLNIGTTVAIPEQVIGVNDLVRKVSPISRLADAVTPAVVTDASDRVTDSARSAIDERRKALSSELSQEQQEADKKQYFTDEMSWANLAKDGITGAPGKVANLIGQGKAFGPGWSDWRKVTGSAAESAPGTLISMGPTAMAARTVAKTTFAKTLAETGNAEIAQAAATKAAERVAMLAGGASEGVQGAGGANEQTRRKVMEMPIDVLRKSDYFRQAVAENGGDEALARKAAADAAATDSALGAFAFDSIFGALGDKYIGTATAGGGRRSGAVARGMAQETPTEFIQSGGEQASENLGVKRYADPNQQLLADVGEQAVGGALSGGLMGGLMGGAFHRGSAQSSGNPTLPSTSTGDPAVDNAINADSVFGAPAAQPAAPEILAAPTILDGNSTVAANPAKPPPPMLMGKQDAVKTERGDEIAFNWALVPIDQENRSHDADLRVNPDYPAQFQPRDRTREASQVQAASMEQNYDPSRAGWSPDIQNGAPYMDANGVVLSGNQRGVVQERILRKGGEKADALRNHWIDTAEQYGFTPTEMAQALQQNPMLALRRVLTTSVNPAEFARQANSATVAQMSPSEQSRSDAARITYLDDLSPTESGDFSSSHQFIQRFVGALPQNEQGGMMDANGQLSQTGYARIRNAVLAKAYGDSPALLRMVESLDDNLRNISKALMQVAPKVAKARDGVAQGALYPMDITQYLLPAVEELSRLRDRGVSVSQALSQMGMFGGSLRQESRQLLAFLDENIRRPRKIADFISAYLDALEASGNPNQGSLLSSQVPTSQDLLNAARRESDEPTIPTNTLPGASLSRGPTAGDQQATPAGESQPNDQERGSAGPGESGRVGTNPKNVYRAYPLTPADREMLLRKFPPTHPRVIADHISAEALDHMDKVVEGPASGEVIGELDKDGVQAMIVMVNGQEVTSGGTPFHITWSVEPGIRTSRIGAEINRLGFKKLAHPIKIDLSSGPTVSSPLRGSEPRNQGETDKEFAKRVVDKRQPPNSLPEDYAKYFKMDGATVVPIANLISTKSAEENAQGGENGAKRMAAAAQGELSTRAPITVMPSTTQPGKYEVVDGNDTLTSVSKYVWESLPVTIVSRQEGLAMIEADKWKDRSKGNYKPPTLASVVPNDVFVRVTKLVEKWKNNLPEAHISEEDRIKAEALLSPVIESAKKDEGWFDSLVKSVAESAGIAYRLGQTKKIGRAATKLVLDENFNVDGMKDIVRATIVVNSYDDAQGVIDEIASKFKIRQINNKSALDIQAPTGTTIKHKGVTPEGYSDVTAFVRLPSGGTAEIQINTPEMLSAKGAGHILYEGSRVVKDDPVRHGEYTELRDGQLDLYQAALASALTRRASATEFKKYASSELAPFETGAPGNGTSSTLSSSNRNHFPSGNLTNSSPPNEDMNSQPAGNLAGTFISSTSDQSLAQNNRNSYNPSVGAPNEVNDAGVVKPGQVTQAEEGRALVDEGVAEIGAWVRQNTPGTSMLTAEEKAQILPALSKVMLGLMKIGITNFKEVVREAKAKMKEAFPKLWNKILPEDYAAAARTAVEQFESGSTNEEQQNDNPSQDGGTGPQGPGADAVQTVVRKRKAPVVRGGQSGFDFGPDRKPNDPTSEPPGPGAGTGPDQAGGNTPGGGQRGPGGSTGNHAGLPAGRDIPVKTGRNYAFSDSDLTYEGGWLKKATQNVDAIELALALEKEGRQATREEQATLAKFIGWGASEIANSIFGPALDQQLETVAYYEDAIGWMDEHKRDSMQRSQGRHYAAFKVLLAKKPGINFYAPEYSVITRAQLEAAKPNASAKKWAALRDRLKAALSAEEWETASRSTQNAHYTSKAIVQSLWKAVDKLGFKGGAILEPGAGIGVFPGLMPAATAANSSYTGIEFDHLTGAILKQLFPDERILVESYVDSTLPDNFYDVAIGNPPFAPTKILADAKYRKHAFALHDYFFAKTIDKIKPGGLMVFVSSRFTMDKKDDKARAYLADRADLIGAIRLPQTAFQKNAGTEVVTDVLFLRKHDKAGTASAHAQSWAKVSEVKTPEGPYLINEYFAAHPEMVLGSHSGKGSMYGKDQYTVIPKEGDIEAQFAAAVENLPANVFTTAQDSAAMAAKVRDLDFNPKAQKEGNYYLSDAGVVMQRESGMGVRVQANEKNLEVLKSYITLRDALKQAQYDQLNDGPWEKSLAALGKAYKAFVAKHGRINQATPYMQRVKAIDEETGESYWDQEKRWRFPLVSIINDDTDYTLALALETFNEETGEIGEAPVLSARVLAKRQAPQIVSAMDAMLATMNELGKVDIPAIATRLGVSEQQAVDALGSMIYEDPSAGWQTRDEYLSGNVRKKLQEAEAAAKSDRRFERNIPALIDAQPTWRSREDINLHIGQNWIPPEMYSQFLKEVVGAKVEVTYNQKLGAWDVTQVHGLNTMEATTDWGTREMNAADILEAALSAAPIRVMVKSGSGKDAKMEFSPALTEAAKEKLEKMREAFTTWAWQDQKRADFLVKTYNEKMNTIVPRVFDGSHLTLPGVKTGYDLFDHVKRGAWRIIQTGNTYLAHAVGSGKSNQMIISAMEQKRLGLISKPMMVVPNHMLQQFTREWLDLYPAARLMVADETQFTGDNRRRFISRVALSDLDGVIITHSSFGLLDLDPEFKQRIINQELDVMRAVLEEAGGNNDNRKFDKNGKWIKSRDPKIKRIEQAIESLEQKLDAAMDSSGKDKNVRFDEMGVDMVYVDEAHQFRKLAFATNQQIKGIDTSGSKRAFDLYMKTRWLEEKHPGRSLVMASGTPVTNTLAELYTVQKFMAPQILEERGISNFNAWSAMFGRETSSLEPTPSGGYEMVTRFARFENVPELVQMFREFADVLTSDDLASLLGGKRPKVENGSRQLVLAPKTEEYRAYQQVLAQRMTDSKNWKGPDINPDPIIRIIGDGRLAAIDMRFIDPKLPSNPNSKFNRMIDGIIATYKETADWEYNGKDGKVEPNKGATQIVFADLGLGEGAAKNRGFNARAWMEKRLRDAGVNPAHVAFMSDYKRSIAKANLFKDVNAGKVRILVGTTLSMGTGVNAQQRLIAEHHLDAPWFPADLEQREGRIIRTGNKNKNVRIFAYSTKGTYDEQMWGLLRRKQAFIDQAMSGDDSVRSVEDLSEASLLEQLMGMVAEDPRVMELAGLNAEVERYVRMKNAHSYALSQMANDYKNAGFTIEFNERRLPIADKFAAMVEDLSGDKFKATVGSESFDKRKDWGAAILAAMKDKTDRLTNGAVELGKVSGFPIVFAGRVSGDRYEARLAIQQGDEYHLLSQSPTDDPVGLAMRVANVLGSISRLPGEIRTRIKEANAKINALAGRLSAPFEFEESLQDAIYRADKLKYEIQRGDRKELTFDADEWANPTTMLSRGREPSVTPASVTRQDAERTLGNILATFKGSRFVNANLVHLVDSFAELPAEVQADARDQGGNERNVYGVIDRGNHVWVVLGNHASLAHVEETLFHELRGHLGTRAFLGNKLVQGMNNIFTAMGGWGGLKALAEKHGAGDIIEDYRRAMFAKDGKSKAWETDVKIAVLTDEVLARIAGKQRGTMARIKEWLGQFRQWLRDHGFAALPTFTDADVHWFLRQSLDGLVRGELNGGARYVSMSMLSEDLAQQEKWLEERAKSAGYADVEQLLEKDYPAFERLAEQWRNQHPVEGAMLARGMAKINRKILDWAERLANTRLRIDPVMLVSATPSNALKLVGLFRPIVIDMEHARHAMNAHPEITPSDFAALPDLLDRPRAILKHANGWRVIVDARDGKGNPLAVALTQDSLGHGNKRFKVTEVSTLFGKDGSAAYLVKELLAGNVAYLPGKEIAHLEDLLSRPQLPLQAGNSPATNTPLGQNNGRTIKILSDDALVNFSRNQNGDWQSRTVGIVVPDGSVAKVGRAAFSIGPAIRHSQTANERADALINKRVATFRPLDATLRVASNLTGISKVTEWTGGKIGQLIDRLTPESVKAGVVSDYGVPEAVIDARALLSSSQRKLIRTTGALIDKLSTLTRAESRVAYEWMNSQDPQSAEYFRQQLPAESLAVLADVEKMIDQMSQEAVRLGQLDPESFKRNRFAYLHRTYQKHMAELTQSENKTRTRAISILGDQYKGRGMVAEAAFGQIKNIAPEWWNRKTQNGKADAKLVGEKFVRLERRAPNGEGVATLEEIQGPGQKPTTPQGRLLEVVYWPTGEAVPSRYGSWDRAGTWEGRTTKGDKLIVWRDFTKEERVKMGEVDEVRYAIAKTLHGMIHDVEVGKYLEWLARSYATKPGESAPGPVVEATESMLTGFAPGTWVQVPDTKVPGTNAKKYGALAGRYLPGPIWNDVRQTVGFRFKPLGEVYAKILSWWKTSKTVLSPAVHTNNIMANFVMADWNDVSAGHVWKALRILLAANAGEGKGALGGLGNVAGKAGISDTEAAKEVLARFEDSGGSIGTWATNELRDEQIAPLVEAMEHELTKAGTSNPSVQVGVYAALQHILHLRAPEAWAAIKGSKPAKMTAQEAKSMLALYENEDQVFRLAAWLKTKEEGASDTDAGKVARKSFLDYHITAPWIQGARQTGLPFISFVYRAAPMMLSNLQHKPWKLAKLAMMAGAVNALGYLASGGDEDDERRLLPEEKAGRVWGVAPKLVRMPWNDANGSPVFLDIRRWVPVGDLLDTGQNHSAVPLLPVLVPGGPLAMLFEFVGNKTQFTGKPITLETDTATEKAAKTLDWLWKSFAPNIAILPGTYAWTGISNAASGKTDVFGREQSTTQAIASAFGVKVGAYPRDVLMRNITIDTKMKANEIDRGIHSLGRELAQRGISQADYEDKLQVQVQKKIDLYRDLSKRIGAGGEEP